MLKTKNGFCCLVIVAAFGLLAGCAPPGRRDLLEGRRLLEEGNYEAAVAKLKAASLVLPKNAVVLNELALAYHQSGLATNAARAYRKALELNPDLLEARYNLGCLLFEQNKLDGAKAEFTAYTMRRPKAAEGWLKLGLVQLRLRELNAAEKSFGDALRANTNNAAALNGLGLVHMQRNRPHEAAQAFSAALNAQPIYGPATLNLAVVSQVLNNRQLAVEKYRAYAALKPRPPDADAVLGMVHQLEQELGSSQRVQATNATAKAIAAASALAPKPSSNLAKQASMTGPPAFVPPTRTDVETVVLPEQPSVKIARDTASAEAVKGAMQAALPEPALARASAPPPQPEKRGILQKLNPLNWFHSGSKPRPPPLPALTNAAPVATPGVARSDGGAVGIGSTAARPPSSTPVAPSPPTPQPSALSLGDQAVKVPRYTYRYPAKPAPGDRKAAGRAFAQGLQAQRANRPLEAIQSYRQAVEADPSYFEAYYNMGVAAHEAKLFQQALSAYETALAINPESANARYNFALALRDAGHLLDAANELEKTISANPNDARAHFAVGNLYAIRLRQPAQARLHYVKVLEIEPQHPQATSIRYWLAANPG
jgi:tetratricopeptide (TPR) repeat protein